MKRHQSGTCLPSQRPDHRWSPDLHCLAWADLLIECSFVTFLNYNCCCDYLLCRECAKAAITAIKRGISQKITRIVPYIRLSYLSNPCFCVACGVAAVPWKDVDLLAVFIGGGLVALLDTMFPVGGGGIENEE